MDDDYQYRPKFTDIRVKPPGGERSRASEARKRVCEHDECDLVGEHPAPKRVGDGKHWFCKKHAAEYNRSFNFFDTMNEEQLKAFNESARYGHTPTWKFGSGPMNAKEGARSGDSRLWQGRELYEDIGEGRASRQAGRKATGVAARALGELDLDPSASPTEIRTRYAEYVRRFHPDSNGGDRSSEHKLARVIRAGKTLKAAGLMKD